MNKSHQQQWIVAQNSSDRQIIPLKPELLSHPFWAFSSLGLIVGLVGLFVYSRWKNRKMVAAIAYEQRKIESLEKRLNTALATIRKWEENPDLVHSRDCNLDYIRMRMQEPTFHGALTNQAKVKVKQFISTALRINLSKNAGGGVASRHGFKIDEIFDITYETDIQGKRRRRVLFRIQVKLMKLPTQSTSSTVNQIVECVETFLSPIDDRDNWQPTIQGHIVSMSWNQMAKPTPLLLIEQHTGGANVNFRTKKTTKNR
ncbi:hypothetical protein [Myxosarcina sp. GI1]|uniref:hypothetical protein n=1 Tax=Myxosarcina sp. GI1 TaxID=1541065 RepID=UPI00055DAC00|nr:hypothetical protein [Myxosarcina sp. GI1]